MLGFLQQWEEAGLAAGALTAILAAGRASLLAWRSLKRRTREAWSAAVDSSDMAHLVRYHLGPNGTTTPMHTRMARLEQAHNIEDATDPLGAP